MGGEKVADLLVVVVQSGSPPRGRGKGCCSSGHTGQMRITPAWAGKSYIFRQCHISPTGSPPRGRGKATKPERSMNHGRITPAWAGKRTFPAWFVKWFGDHPRVGGEKWNCLFASASALGSPPRGRGKGKAVCPQCGKTGITPAWAGKSGHTYRNCNSYEDHPRVGGEKVPLHFFVCSV